MGNGLRVSLPGVCILQLLLWGTTIAVSAAPPTPTNTRATIAASFTAVPKPNFVTPPGVGLPRSGSATAIPPNANGGKNGGLPAPSAPDAYLTTAWNDPVPVSENRSSWFPDIALDSAGTTHIVWNASDETPPGSTTESAAATPTSNIRDYLMYQRIGSTPPVPATDIGLSHGGEAIRNAIIVAHDGSVDVLYRSQEHIWFIRAPVAGAVSANAWSIPHRISGTGTAYYAAIAEDDAGVLHAVYSENTLIDSPPSGPIVRRQSLFYRHSADGGVTWSTQVRLSSPTSPHGNTRPQIRIQGETIVVAWDEGYDNINAASTSTNGNIRRSLDGGMTWQPTQRIADIAGPIEQLTYAFGSTNQALLVWRVTTVDVMRFSTTDDGGKTWREAATVPNFIARPYLNKHQFDRYALIADRTGRFHLLAVGQDRSTEQVALMHLEFSEMGWTLPEIVYEGDGYPEYPGAVTDGGNRLVIAFFVRDTQFEIGNYRVWRADARTAGSIIQPIGIPTGEPAARPVKPFAPPIAFATPIMPPGSILPEERPTIDHPIGIPPLGQSIFAAFGLAMAVAVGRIWWMKRSDST